MQSEGYARIWFWFLHSYPNHPCQVLTKRKSDLLLSIILVQRGLQSDFMRRWCNPIAHPDDVWKQCRFLGRRYLGMRLLISTLLPDPLNTPRPKGELLNLTEYYSTSLRCCFLLFWSKGVMRGWRGTNVCVSKPKEVAKWMQHSTLVNNNTPR